MKNLINGFTQRSTVLWLAAVERAKLFGRKTSDAGYITAGP